MYFAFNFSRFEEGNSNEPEKSGFAPHNDVSDEESPPRQPRNESNRNSGAQIAPPPSLLESVETNTTQIQEKPSYGVPYGASSVAAKIMAKYGFKVRINHWFICMLNNYYFYIILLK